MTEGLAIIRACRLGRVPDRLGLRLAGEYATGFNRGQEKGLPRAPATGQA
jgi:hypothetical protein